MAYGIASPYNERALRVDQISPRLLENFGEDIPTSPQVIEVHTLILSQILNFRDYIFFGGGRGDPRPR